MSKEKITIIVSNDFNSTSTIVRKFTGMEFSSALHRYFPCAFEKIKGKRVGRYRLHRNTHAIVFKAKKINVHAIFIFPFKSLDWKIDSSDYRME